MCKFSVVISIYSGDSAQYLQLSIQSILNQTMVPSEIIIAVDGPIGVELENLLSSLIKKHHKIIVIRNKVNSGLGASRHRAILASSYSIVAVMDADDISVATRFEKQIPLLCDGSYDVVGGWIEEFKFLPGDSVSVRKVPKEHRDIVKFCKRRSPMNHVTIAFQKNFYMQVGGYKSIRYVEDWDLFYRMLTFPSRFYNIAEVMVFVRCGDGMIARRGGLARLIAEVALLNRMYTSKFINLMDYLTGICFRLPMRIMPSSLRGYFYKSFFRS